MLTFATPHEVTPPTNVETLAALLAELAVAYADPDAREAGAVVEAAELARKLAVDVDRHDLELDVDDFLDALSGPTSAGVRWREQLFRVFQAVPAGRLSMWLADNCILSALLEGECLTGGPFQRRLDAVLDLADVSFSATDVQATFGVVANNLAAAKVTWSHTGAALAGSIAVGFAGGFVGFPFAGALGGKGGEYLLDQASRVDELSEACARMVVAAYAAADHNDAETACTLWRYVLDVVADRARVHGAKKQRQAGGANILNLSEVERQLRVLQAAEQDVRALLGDRRGSGFTLPDLTGMSVANAQELVQAMGYDVRTVDSTSQSRTVWNPGSWQVDSHVSPSWNGQPKQVVTLQVRKFGE